MPVDAHREFIIVRQLESKDHRVSDCCSIGVQELIVVARYSPREERDRPAAAGGRADRLKTNTPGFQIILIYQNFFLFLGFKMTSEVWF